MYAKSRDAFDLKAEKPDLAKRYGNNDFGRSALLMARRLVEKKVCASSECSMGGWDTHQNNFVTVQNNLLKLDPAVGSLLEDLNARGLLKRTMVVCTGEFGRTPKINANDGRDHWPKCWTALLAGGGLKGGYAHGATDATGSDIKDNPVHVSDLHATLFQAALT